MKKCTYCKEMKPLTEFYRNKHTKDGLQHRCISCHKALKPVYDEETKRKYHERYMALKETHIRDYKLRRDFGITLADYQQMFAEQKGCCAICGQPPKEGKKLFVDHDHETKKVRGLLCHHCNSLLGYAREDLISLNNAFCYLTQHGMALVKMGERQLPDGLVETTWLQKRT